MDVIPKDWLVMIVGVRHTWDLAPEHVNGRTGTVVGHELADAHGCTHIVQVGGTRYSCVRHVLRPIAPPGNPDEVVTREPERVGGIR